MKVGDKFAGGIVANIGTESILVMNEHNVGSIGSCYDYPEITLFLGAVRNGWRLPTIEEFKIISTIDGYALPANTYWTSTPGEVKVCMKAVVHREAHLSMVIDQYKSSKFRVRLVKSVDVDSIDEEGFISEDLLNILKCKGYTHSIKAGDVCEVKSWISDSRVEVRMVTEEDLSNIYLSFNNPKVSCDTVLKWLKVKHQITVVPYSEDLLTIKRYAIFYFDKSIKHITLTVCDDSITTLEEAIVEATKKIPSYPITHVHQGHIMYVNDKIFLYTDYTRSLIPHKGRIICIDPSSYLYGHIEYVSSSYDIQSDKWVNLLSDSTDMLKGISDKSGFIEGFMMSMKQGQTWEVEWKEEDGEYFVTKIIRNATIN